MGNLTPQCTRAAPHWLSIADVCADLGISRSIFYDWRAKGRCPHCINSPAEWPGVRAEFRSCGREKLLQLGEGSRLVSCRGCAGPRVKRSR